MTASKNYKAFISYSHRDQRWARWLHRRIESYQVPRHLVGQPAHAGPVPRHLSPVFRDRDELASAPDLSARIQEALEASENLVVICSPAAAASTYVNREVEIFKRLGRSARVFTLIVAGDPAAKGTAQDCFPPALRQAYDEQGRALPGDTEPIAADARPQGDGRSPAGLKIIAGLLGVGLDDLRQRELQRRLRRMAVVTGVALAALAVTIALAISAHLARQEAEQRRMQAEGLLGFMVEDLRDSLQPLGRLDLLEKVGAQAMDYFATVKVGNLTDEELIRHAQVMTQLGEIRISQRQYDDALHSFQQAHARSAELYRNDPEDGVRLFNRGQAEFWVGYVHWRRGDLEAARNWLTRYLESSVELAAMDPSRQDWAIEVVYGQHNLAVLALDAQDLDAARAGFTAEIEALRQVGRADANYDPRPSAADAHSWLGNIEFTAGDLGQALFNYSAAAALYEALREEAPDDRTLQYSWSHAANFVAHVQVITGDREHAARLADEAIRVLDELVAHDLDNLEWLRSSAKPRITRAAVHAAEGAWAPADELLVTAVGTLERMVEGDNTDLSLLEALADAELLRAWVAIGAGDPAAAGDSLGRARVHIRDMESRSALNDERRGRLAAALVLEGELQAAGGNLAGARQNWQAALRELALVDDTTGSPLVRDPLARALALTGQHEQASRVRARLDQHGYRPIRPWPAAADGVAD